METKHYFTILLISSFLLLLFPFLALPELFENIYVVIFAFIVGYFSLLLRKKVVLEDEDLSLQHYIKDLKEKFKNQENAISQKEKKSKKISEVIPHE